MLFGNMVKFSIKTNILIHKMQLARLPPDDATAVYNMRLLESSSDPKKNSIVPFSLKFDVHKVVNIQNQLW